MAALKAKDHREDVDISSLLDVSQCVQMLLAYVREQSARTEVVECLDLLCQVAQREPS